MKSFHELSLTDIHEVFDGEIISRGEEYFEEGFIKNIELLNPATLIGVVEGNQSYNVSVTIDSEGDLLTECSCPCDFPCKHAAALLLAWLSQKKDTSSSSISKIVPRESFEDALSKKNKKELLEILKTSITKYPELKSLVVIRKNEIISKVRSLFSGFWEWNQVGGLISQLETLLEGIQRNKSSWNNSIVEEMHSCAIIMIKGMDSVHDEGDLGIFLEDWFKVYGEVFASTNPPRSKKEQFIQQIVEFIKKDDYGLESSFEKALVGMCSNKEDIQLIKDEYNSSSMRKERDEEWENEEGEEKDYFQQFYLKLYEHAGLNKEYILLAKKEGLIEDVINKLIFLQQWKEALKECNENKGFTEEIEQKKIIILRKLGKNKEVKSTLLQLISKTGDLSYAVQLKETSSKEEWKTYLQNILTEAKNKKRSGFLSRLYFHEQNFKRAYKYSSTLSDISYLELLAKKLSTNYPELSCNLYRRLCFSWINTGSGWPYQKAGKMLGALKKLDKKGELFKKTKREIILKHKKKWSLMQIIEKI